MTVAPAQPAPDRTYLDVVAVVPRRASLRMRLAHNVFRATVRKFFDFAVWIDGYRVLTPQPALFVAGRVDLLAAPLRARRGTRRRRVDFENFRAEWVWDREIEDPAHKTDAAIVYFHGGGLISCGLNTHRRHVARVARTAGVPLLNVDYRQIPRAHVTDSIQDCLTAYTYLLDQGFAADRIIAAGDSAGGGLAFSMVLAARAGGLPLPGAIVAIAPWADYDSTVRRAHPNSALDALLSAEAYAIPARWGMEINGRIETEWSPVNHDFAGLPSTLIQVASTEVLLADAEQLARRCVEAGVPYTLQIWEKGIHVFQVAADFIPDARDAVDEIAGFIRGVLDTASKDPGESLAVVPAAGHS